MHSKTSRDVRRAVALALATAVAAPLAWADAGPQLEEIVVTAQKREETLREVPISVNAIAGDKIEEVGIVRLDDLKAYVPNLQVTEAGIAQLLRARHRPTADQIFQEVRRQVPAISFNTVYKTLEALCHKGLIIKGNPLHEVARYDARAHNHTHLICRTCHRIYDLDRELPPFDVGDSDLPPGFKVESQDVIFWGLCPRCQDSQPS